MAVTYPEGMTPELASRLYDRVTVSWSSKPFVFDPERSECRAWLEQGALDMESGDTYATGTWPRLVNVIRRGEDNAVRVFQFSNGFVYEQET